MNDFYWLFSCFRSTFCTKLLLAFLFSAIWKINI